MSEETNVQALWEENTGLRVRIEALRAGKNRLREDLATAIEELKKANVRIDFLEKKRVPEVKPRVDLFGEATRPIVTPRLETPGLFGEATRPVVTPFSHTKEARDAIRSGGDAIVNGQWITLSTFRRLEKRFAVVTKERDMALGAIKAKRGEMYTVLLAEKVLLDQEIVNGQWITLSTFRRLEKRFAVVTKERDAAVSEVDELRKWKAFLEGGVAGLKYKLSAVTTERDVAVGVITANKVSQDEAYATLLAEKVLLEQELTWSREDVEGLEGRINLMSLKATETMGEGDSDR